MTSRTTVVLILCPLLGAVAATAWSADENGIEEEVKGQPAGIHWSPALEISGFGDIVSFYTGRESGLSFQVGQAEVDLAADLGRRVGADIAIAYGRFLRSNSGVPDSISSLCTPLAPSTSSDAMMPSTTRQDRGARSAA